MTRRHVLAGLLWFSCLPVAVWAAPPASASASDSALTQVSQSPVGGIESLELQYLSSKDPEQRRQALSELKALAKNSAGSDAGALNRAVSAMLPAADSVEAAEALLTIAAAHPAGAGAGELQPVDRKFLVDAREAAQAARRPSGDVEALADIRIDHLRKDSLGRDGLTSAHVQQIWRINSAQGARSFSPRSLTYAAMSETLCLVRARVLKRDGRELQAVVSADQPVVERSSSMYFDSRSRDLHFAQLAAGDVVEIEYDLLPASEVNPWAGYYARLDLFRDSLPTRLRRRVVIAPSTMKLYAVEHGLRPAVVEVQGEETTRVWEMRDIAAQAFEALSPGASASSEYLHVSTIGTMAEFGHWYNGLLEPALRLDENLRDVAAAIAARNLSTLGKVQAVYESVQRSTRYVAFEFGVHSYQPYPVALVERRGFGDCKDKAAMIVALLRAVGVPAEFAMVRTRSAGAMSRQAYSIQLFNHAVAYVPELNLYLDGTAEYAALGELPPDDQGAMAITVDADGTATLRTVPFSAPESNRVTRSSSKKNMSAKDSVNSVAKGGSN